MGKKILLVDYIGSVNREGKPVGHSLKVFQETCQLLEGDYFVSLAAPQAYLTATGRGGTVLPMATDAAKSGKNVVENVRCMLRSFCNIRAALKSQGNDLIWFYNVDQFLFMYLGLFGFHGKRVAVTCFAQKYPKFYHNFFFRKVLPKLALMVSSNPERDVDTENLLYIPDYLYRKERYQVFRRQTKQEKVVCVGTMNRSKKIKELVEVWNDINYPLEIYGFFYDDVYYQDVMRIKAEHIQIRNEYVDYRSYLEILGAAKYCVLPYEQEAYVNTTSGVMLESIFLGVIPITCNMLLAKMKIDGIGYRQLDDLKMIDWRSCAWDQKVVVNDKKVAAIYDEEIYKRKLLQKISTTALL